MTLSRLFHVSEEAGITIFRPRPVPTPITGGPDFAVWAVDEGHLANYLLPRDCPRVTFRVAPTSTGADIERFFDKTTARRMIVVEQAWLNRILATPLFVYEMPPDSFVPIDASAGYFISPEPIRPLGVERLEAPVEEIARQGCELRLVPDLWPIRDGVVNSTLDYSIIRMRNALPRL